MEEHQLSFALVLSYLTPALEGAKPQALGYSPC